MTILTALYGWAAVNGVLLFVFFCYGAIRMGLSRNGPVQGEAEREDGPASAGELAEARAVAQEVSLMALDPIRRN